MEKKRITILLGAGAVCEATNVSTSSITKKVIKECKGYKITPDKNQSVVDYICKEYWETFNKYNIDYKPYSKSKLDDIVKVVNFEDIFHVLELMMGFSMKESSKKFTSAYKVFARFKKKFSNVDRMSVISSVNKVIEIVNNIVSEYSNHFHDKSTYFSTFIKKLENDFIINIFNLNYDTWCEQSLSSYCDGFVEIPGYDSFQRFSIEKYRENYNRKVNTIAHLHGSILYGLPDFKSSDINRYAYEDSRDCLYKYRDFTLSHDVRQRIFRSNLTNQAGETIAFSNIITGLMKTDKLLISPYMEYEHHFYHALTSNERLLLVGYGFNDQYINRMLWGFQTQNIQYRKVMLITKVDEKSDWQPQITPPLFPDQMTKFSMLMFKNQGWFAGVDFSQVEKGYYSDDNMAALYTCGLKCVADNYLNDVIRFFKNEIIYS